MIERCPKTMMLRELVRNAVEAACTAPEPKVVIGAAVIDGISKLRIWNTGRGLTADELHRMCDIASSIGKPHGLDGNFGMGAKVASLPSNQRGLRYRSCRDGVVHEVVLAKLGGVYGRLRRDGRDVVVASDAARRDGHALDADWTEVVLLGNAEAQDTLADPYGGDPHSPADWLVRGLCERFFRLPEGVCLLLPDGSRFAPLAPGWAGFARHSAVEAADGVVLHFLHDPTGRLSGAGVVHRDEIYDVRREGNWVFHAPQFGIPFGARQIGVYVELPPAHPVRADGYRQFLRYRDSHQHHVETPHFARLVASHRPDWLLALIASLSPDARQTDAVRGELGELARRLRIRRTRPRPPVVVEAEAVVVAPCGAASDDFDAEPPPEIVPLREAADIDAHGLAGRGGRYIGETHQLFVNLRHGSVAAMEEALCRQFAGQPDQDRVRRLAVQEAEAALVRRVGRALLHAMAWRDGASGFAGWEVDQAMAVPSLSLAAEDYAESLTGAIESMAAALRVPARRARFAVPRLVAPVEPSLAAPRRNRALLTLVAMRAWKQAVLF